MDTVRVHDKNFNHFIDNSEIKAKIIEMAKKIDSDLAGKKPIILRNSKWIIYVCW